MKIFSYNIVNISLFCLYTVSIGASEAPVNPSTKAALSLKTVIKHLAAGCFRVACTNNYSRICFDTKDQSSLPISFSVERYWFEHMSATEDFRDTYDPVNGPIGHFKSRENYIVTATSATSYALTLDRQSTPQQIDFNEYSAFVNAAQEQHRTHKRTLVASFGAKHVPEHAHCGSAIIQRPFLVTTTNDGHTHLYHYTQSPE